MSSYDPFPPFPAVSATEDFEERLEAAIQRLPEGVMQEAGSAALPSSTLADADVRGMDAIGAGDLDDGETFFECIQCHLGLEDRWMLLSFLLLHEPHFLDLLFPAKQPAYTCPVFRVHHRSGDEG